MAEAMTRAVVNVATTEHTRKGQRRLKDGVLALGAGAYLDLWEQLPSVWPKHEDKPYAFKAYALMKYLSRGYDSPLSLLWCDACILPVRSLKPAWTKIERDGYLLMNNGFSNYEWTADSAYPDLFAKELVALAKGRVDRTWDASEDLEFARSLNRSIPHTVGGFFGLSMRHEIGRKFLRELYRLASETRAFCGPSINSNAPKAEGAGYGPGAPCGPPDVRGHRHDQTAMSVIAWRLGMKLTDAPEFLIYGKAEDAHDIRTIAVADGSYA